MATEALTDDHLIDDHLTDALSAQPACNDGTGALVELFFSEDLHDIARAKHLCSTCPVRLRCFQGALERAEPCGVWGGELFENGRVAHKRRRGRPPKYRPAEMMVIDGIDVVVVPEIRSA